MTPLILASQSPRRKEILSWFHIPFIQKSPIFCEELAPYQGNAKLQALHLAEEKGKSLAHQFPDSIILSADTIVHKNEVLFGKPQGKKDAISMLEELSGDWHSVITGVALIYKGETFSMCEETRVLFNPLSTQEISLYLDQIQWSDKAGGYAIQLGAGLIVKRIEGCYTNVMGLPINSLKILFEKIGISLLEHIKE